MLLVTKARGWQVYSRCSVARRVERRADRGSRKLVRNESMSVSPWQYERVLEQETASPAQRVRKWKRIYKEGREQHNIRQGNLAFGAVPHLGEIRTLPERGWCCTRSRSVRRGRTCEFLYDGEMMDERSAHSKKLWHTMIFVVKKPRHVSDEKSSSLPGGCHQIGVTRGKMGSRRSRSVGERRSDRRMPLLLTTSHPLSEEGWQFRQALKSWSRI